ncbi:MAG: cupin domain-containing protein [Caldilineaceae bacterium]|nr:cupin domain-containing protein [Caldilineaceae bacterium]
MAASTNNVLRNASQAAGAAVPPFPGGVGLSHLRVYDTIAPDGQMGGSPHMHLVCSEAYIVLGGTGKVESLGPQGYRELMLEPGRIVWFTPGIIHRLVNLDGKLEILVIMQNSGLPEAGDFIFAFPQAVMADASAYARASSLARHDRVFASDDDAAHGRRDLAVLGMMELRRQYEQEGIAALTAFYEAGLRILQPGMKRWQAIWQAGAEQVARDTGQQLEALLAGHIDHLLASSIHEHSTPTGERSLGMCGTLALYLPEGTRI